MTIRYENLLSELEAWQAEYRPVRYILALSGGVDSVVLLHLLAAARNAGLSVPLEACHINHGWHGNADTWSSFCADMCAALAVDYSTVCLDLPKQSRVSREAQARTARYAALASRVPAGGVLLTAHHQDDQAETLLLQLLRGAGLAGLAAMPKRQQFARGEHWRPLLNVARSTIEQYALMHGLRWIDDPSNTDLRYARNRIRHEVMPVLAAGFPAVSQQLARSAAWIGEAQTLLAEAADVYLPGEISDVLEWAELASLREDWQRAVLRRWLQRLGVQPLGHRQMSELVRQLREGSGYIELTHDDHVFIFYRGVLRLLPHLPIAAVPHFAHETHWPGIGKLHVRAGCDDGADWSWSLYPPGGRFQPADKKFSKPIKHWFQQAGVAPYLRRRTPLLWRNGEVVWIGGLGVAAGAESLLIDWQKPRYSATILPTLRASD